MAVTMAEISKLRQLTGAGMMDCKKALAESDGDMEKAVKILRGIEDIAIHEFSDRDVVRHRLVQQIILAYEKHASKQNERRRVYSKSERTVEKK